MLQNQAGNTWLVRDSVKQDDTATLLIPISCKLLQFEVEGCHSAVKDSQAEAPNWICCFAVKLQSPVERG